VVKNAWLTGQTWWLAAMVFVISSSLLGSVNFITTLLNLRARGMSFFRLPFFCWAMLVTSFLLLLAFPPLEVAAILQLFDRVFDSSFFLPTGLVQGGKLLDISGGGSPLLYQHLFWFLAHPEVYVLILAGLRHRVGRDSLQHSPSALGLQGHGLSAADAGLPELPGLGAPHVSDRHGHHDGHLLPDHHGADLGAER